MSEEISERIQIIKYAGNKIVAALAMGIWAALIYTGNLQTDKHMLYAGIGLLAFSGLLSLQDVIETIANAKKGK